MPYKDPVKRKEYQDQYRANNKEKAKDYYQENKEEYREKKRKYYEDNVDKIKERTTLYREKIYQDAYDSISSGMIINRKNWDMWCKEIKRHAKNNHPYSDDFTNDIMFEMMVQGCFYCGDIATTIDRVDSKLEHKPYNCVGSCHGCNMSKGTVDSSTFIRKAYYRVRREYCDTDNNIWFVHKTKPRHDHYKKKSDKQGVAFDLSNEDFNQLIRGDCAYCHRSPSTWFGIDRVIPSHGYVSYNVVSCCFDCNLDKHINDVNETLKRNERIVERVEKGELVITDCEKTNLYMGSKNTNKVYAYGNVYANKSEASRALGKNDAYVTHCIQRGTHSKYIFEIHDDFQSDVK
jgi:hypothetical protein